MCFAIQLTFLFKEKSSSIYLFCKFFLQNMNMSIEYDDAYSKVRMETCGFPSPFISCPNCCEFPRSCDHLLHLCDYDAVFIV